MNPNENVRLNLEARIIMPIASRIWRQAGGLDNDISWQVESVCFAIEGQIYDSPRAER